MAQVFLSYDREDSAKVRIVAEALERAGHTVWWDRHIKGGAQYSKEIERALEAADAVVVLWSENSIESAWVRDEAASGRDRGRLVPIGLDGTEPPLGFRQYQTIDLAGGRLSKAKRQAILGAIEAVAGTSATQPLKRAVDSIPTEVPAYLLIVGLVLVTAMAGLLLWKPWANRDEIVLSIGPTSNDAASHALARDLAMKLGTLQSSTASNIRLVEASEADDANLLFEASASGPANATLVLKSARDSSILWSNEFQQPSGQRADLLQQLAFTAGRLTGCAREGLDGSVRLKSAILKAYLNACAQLSEMATADPKPPIQTLKSIIEASPRFEPAWAKLLLVEAQMVAASVRDGKSDGPALAEVRQLVAQARKISPNMPEASIAEASLLPTRDFIGRARLVDAAAKQSPEDPVILSYLSGLQFETGRVRDAVTAAGKAVQLDPLSPLLHNNFIGLLAYAGSFDTAKRELANAEKLWPGTDSLWDAQFRFHLRYGDPRIALAIFEERTDAPVAIATAPRMFLNARVNPTPKNVESFLAYVRERLTNMENPALGLGFAILAFGHFNRKEDLVSTLLAWPNTDDISAIADTFFRPEMANFRRDPRFMQIAKRAGLLEYWLESGKWPDFCFAEGHSYDCKVEAAKLG